MPGLIEQLRAEAPSRIEAVRNTDPKAVQEKVTTQAKEAQATVQAKVTEVLGHPRHRPEEARRDRPGPRAARRRRGRRVRRQGP